MRKADRVEGLVRHRVHEQRRQHEATVGQEVFQLGRPCRRVERRLVVQGGGRVLFELVEQPVLELVQAADVVDVRVRGHGDDVAAPPAGQPLEHGPERRDPIAGVDEQVALAPAHVPAVRA